jgi:hypothetical protein
MLKKSMDNKKEVKMKKVKKEKRKKKAVEQTLYHFTSLIHIPLILREGLTTGHVNFTPDIMYNAVWFSECRNMDRQRQMLTTSIVDSEGNIVSILDKTQVRITVNFSIDDPNLYKWDELARALNVERWWYKRLDQRGGNGSKHWYVYAGKIETQRFCKVEYRPSTSTAYIDYDIDAEEPKFGIEICNEIDYPLQHKYYVNSLLDIQERLIHLKAA